MTLQSSDNTAQIIRLSWRHVDFFFKKQNLDSTFWTKFKAVHYSRQSTPNDNSIVTHSKLKKHALNSEATISDGSGTQNPPSAAEKWT